MLYDMVSQLLELVAALSCRLARLQRQLAAGEASDGYHTHNELYESRLLLHAHAVRKWVDDGLPVVKSWRHHDGERCLGGDWFIVVAQLETGQFSHHYHRKDWDLFDVPEVELPPAWDGHTGADGTDRLRAALIPKNESR